MHDEFEEKAYYEVIHSTEDASALTFYSIIPVILDNSKPRALSGFKFFQNAARWMTISHEARN